MGETVTLDLQLPREVVPKLTTNMPDQVTSTGVAGVGDAEYVPECGNAALRLAGFAMDEAELAPAAWESAKVTFEVLKETVAEAYGLGTAADAVGFLIKYVDSEDPWEFLDGCREYVMGQVAAGVGSEIDDSYPVKKGASEGTKQLYEGIRRLYNEDHADVTKGHDEQASEHRLTFADRTWDHPECGEIRLYYWLDRHADGAHLHVVVSGNCAKGWPLNQPEAARLGAFHLVGDYRLQAETERDGDEVTVSYGVADRGEWEVFADC